MGNILIQIDSAKTSLVPKFYSSRVFLEKILQRLSIFVQRISGEFVISYSIVLLLLNLI